MPLFEKDLYEDSIIETEEYKHESALIASRQELWQEIKNEQPKFAQQIASNNELKGFIAASKPAFIPNGTETESTYSNIYLYEKLRFYIPDIEITQSKRILYQVEQVKEIIKENQENFEAFGVTADSQISTEVVKEVMNKLSEELYQVGKELEDRKEFETAIGLVLGIPKEAVEEHNTFTQARKSFNRRHSAKLPVGPRGLLAYIPDGSPEYEEMSDFVDQLTKDTTPDRTRLINERRQYIISMYEKWYPLSSDEEATKLFQQSLNIKRVSHCGTTYYTYGTNEYRNQRMQNRWDSVYNDTTKNT